MSDVGLISSSRFQPRIVATAKLTHQLKDNDTNQVLAQSTEET